MHVFAVMISCFSPSVVDDTEEARIYKTLKTQFVQHTQDFETLSKIATLVTTLASDYAVSSCNTL